MGQDRAIGRIVSNLGLKEMGIWTKRERRRKMKMTSMMLTRKSINEGDEKMPENWTTLTRNVAQAINEAIKRAGKPDAHYFLGVAWGIYTSMKFEEKGVFGNKYPNLNMIVTAPTSPEATRAKIGAVDEIKVILGT